MKELVIISSNPQFILEIERFLLKFKDREIPLMASVFDKENKIGIAYTDSCKFSSIIFSPLKKCFKIFKQEFFYNLNLKVSKGVLNQFINLNIDREFEMCFEKVKYTGKIYLDSVFNFLTKEMEYSWRRVGEILSDNSRIFENRKQAESIINFKIKDTKEDK